MNKRFSFFQIAKLGTKLFTCSLGWLVMGDPGGSRPDIGEERGWENIYL